MHPSVFKWMPESCFPFLYYPLPRFLVFIFTFPHPQSEALILQQEVCSLQHEEDWTSFKVSWGTTLLNCSSHFVQTKEKQHLIFWATLSLISFSWLANQTASQHKLICFALFASLFNLVAMIWKGSQSSGEILIYYFRPFIQYVFNPTTRARVFLFTL